MTRYYLVRARGERKKASGKIKLLTLAQTACEWKVAPWQREQLLREASQVGGGGQAWGITSSSCCWSMIIRGRRQEFCRER